MKFYDGNNPDDITWHGGIAYHDFVICGCCGLVIPIQEIIDDAAECGVHWDDAIIELEWVNISGTIRGE